MRHLLRCVRLVFRADVLEKERSPSRWGAMRPLHLTRGNLPLNRISTFSPWRIFSFPFTIDAALMLQLT